MKLRNALTLCVLFTLLLIISCDKENPSEPGPSPNPDPTTAGYIM